MPIKGDMLQSLSREWLPKVTGSHRVHLQIWLKRKLTVCHISPLALSSFPEKCNFKKIRNSVQIISGLKHVFVGGEKVISALDKNNGHPKQIFTDAGNVTPGMGASPFLNIFQRKV